MPSPIVAHAVLAFTAVCGWLTLAALAVAPSGAWPHTGLRGNLERAFLYFVVAAATRAAITEHQTRLQIFALAVAAVLFEMARAWTVGRSNGVAGWASSMAGVVVGAVLLRHVAHTYFWRLGW